jgi:hypothetical protein
VLESLQSAAVIGIAKAVPFPVEFKDRTKDRLFKQVAFPSETIGTYRIRAINTGLRTASVVTQKTVNTHLPLDSADGKLFRVKAVLAQPSQGVSESYWLTLHHNDFSHTIQDHNQYRLRGVTDKGWKSDWVYSEARDEENRLKIYEMIYDILDMVASIQDGDIQAFITMLVEDAFKIGALQESKPTAQVQLGAKEDLNHAYSESAIIQQDDLNRNPNDTLNMDLQVLADLYSKTLYKEFREELLASPQEFTKLFKTYKIEDDFRKNSGDIITLLLENFLEDRMDKVVESVNLQYEVDNGENKAIYLEGRYNFDIKSELLRSAYHLMPTDNFVMTVKSAVKLFTDPYFHDDVDYRVLDETIATLKSFKNTVHEWMDTDISEEILLFMRLLVQDVYLPYAVVDQRMAEIMVDLADRNEKLKVRDDVVEFDLDSPDNLIKHLVVRDLITGLALEDLGLTQDFQAYLADSLLNSMKGKIEALVDYGLEEFIMVLSEIGEKLRTDVEKLPIASRDALQMNASEWITTHSHLLKNREESAMVDIRDQIANASVIQDKQTAELNSIHLIDVSSVSFDSLIRMKEQVILSTLDSLYSKSMIYPQSIKEDENLLLSDQSHQDAIFIDGRTLESMDVQISDRTLSDRGLVQKVQEYFRVVASDDYTHHETPSHIAADQKTVYAKDEEYRIYLMNLKDSLSQLKNESYEVALMADLKDTFVITGHESVLYALGDVSKDGWPIGQFILGTNTLKGGT